LFDQFLMFVLCRCIHAAGSGNSRRRGGARPELSRDELSTPPGSAGFELRALPTWVLAAVLMVLSGVARVGAQPYGLDTRPAIGSFLNNVLPSASQGSVGGWTAVPAFTNLTFDDPVFVTPEPRSDRLYICGRQGTIHFITNHPAVSVKTMFLDLTPYTQGYDDCGLLGIAFHPEFRIAGSTNRGFVYVYYQYSPSPVVPGGGGRPPSATPGYNRLSRFTVPDGSMVADPASEVILINQFDHHVWHNGGGMFFGPDGFLYLSNGDEGAANDSYNQTQKINFGLFAGVLRIDVNMDPTKSHPIRRQPQHSGALPGGWILPSFSTNYYIPNDNPWLDPAGTILEEFYAVGLRSPHRMTFDPPSGRIWLGDIGQGAREEVDIIEKGGNYQWAYREGSIAGPKAKPSPLIGVDKPPVHDYGRSAGDTCVIGGYVYRGTEHAAALAGKYIFGDNTSSRVWVMTYDGVGPTTVTELVDLPWPSNYSGLSSFGLDRNNELYLCKMGRAGSSSPGNVYKLARTGTQPPPPPALLSQTGAFGSLASLTPASGILPFTVNSPLWSDAAVKKRWVAVPNNGAPYGTNETVGFAATGEWTFPNGTVFIKHFDLPVDDTNPSILKRLETRFLVRDTNGGVFGFTYKWRSDNTDADLLPGGLDENIVIQTGSGTRTQVWHFPSRQECLTCHNPTAGYVLGVKTRQLNGDLVYPTTGRTDNQLRTWNHVGLLNPTINEANIPTYPKTVAVTNATATLEHRVRSYLDANCSQCHRPNGVQAYFDARFDTPLTSQSLIGGPLVDPLGIGGAKVIVPQSLAQSVLYQRDNSLANIKMPPLAKNLIDNDAMAVISAWINSLPPPDLLPPPWDDQDIGSPALSGDATYSTGTFTLVGSGADIWNNADAFHFAYRPLNGDGTVVARVTSVQNTDPWAKAGVMIRESLAAGSKHAFMAITPGNGAAFQRRTATDGASVNTAGAVVTAPYWVRLVRAGTLFTASQSADGVTWTTVGSETISMTTSVYVGLALTAHNNAVLNTSSFTDVSVTGPGVNNPPTISNIADQGTGEDTPTSAIQFTVGDAETAAGSLVLSRDSSNPALVPVNNIVFAGSGANRTVTITPAPDQSGTATLTVSVGDGTFTISDTFVLTVNAVNDAPTLADIPDQSIPENGSTGPVSFTIGDIDTAVGSLSLSKASSNPTLVPLSGVVFGGSGSSRTVTVVPASGQTGSATVTVSVSDGSLTNSDSFVVTVTHVNVPPAAGPDSIARYPESGVKVTIAALLANDSDSDGGTVVLTGVTSPTAGGGVVTVAVPWVKYTPAAGYTNADSFTYQIADGQGGVASGTVTVGLVVDQDPTLNVVVEALGGGSFRIRGAGVPGRSYRVQYTESLITPAWQTLATRVGDGQGAMEYVDSPGTGAPVRHYRFVNP